MPNAQVSPKNIDHVLKAQNVRIFKTVYDYMLKAEYGYIFKNRARLISILSSLVCFRRGLRVEPINGPGYCRHEWQGP